MPQCPALARSLVISTCLVLVAACSGGAPTVALSPSESTSQGDTPASSPAPVANPVESKTAPEISGEPVPAVAIGEAYVFQPEVLDPNGDRLSFSISNLPSWAMFDEYTGKLSGMPTPADVGSYRNITISVTDSRETAALAPFTVHVTQIATGTATVSWNAPAHNTDGTALTDLTGYQIHFGRTSKRLSKVVRIPDPDTVRFVVDNLSAGPWYFAVSAVNSKGVQSSLSGVGYKKIS